MSDDLAKSVGQRVVMNHISYPAVPLHGLHRNNMAFSREARLPYLDYDLVDFCLRLPDDLYVRNGWQKWVLREAAGNTIPKRSCRQAQPLDTHHLSG